MTIVPDLVIDASVSVKWIIPDEPASDRAALILEDYQKGTISFLAPLFWQYEIAGAINKAVGRGKLSEPEGRDALESLLSLDMSFEPFPAPREAYTLGRRFQRGIYDSLYLALAELRGCEFWTGDLRLYNAARHRWSFVRWIADYGMPPDLGR